MSYYLLSNGLRDLLAKGSPSRIVNVASNYAGGMKFLRKFLKKSQKNFN